MKVNCNCPINSVASVVGSKWVIVILRDFFLGKRHFNQFLESNEGLSNKVLSAKLKEMIHHELIEKYFDEDSRIAYRLTDNGRALKGVMRELVKYGGKFCSSDYHLLEEALES